MAILDACIGLEIRVGQVAGSILGFRYNTWSTEAVRAELLERLSADAFEHGQWEQKGGVWVLAFAVEGYPCHAVCRGEQYDIRNLPGIGLPDPEPQY